MTLDPQPPPPGDHLVPLCEIPVQSSEGGSALPNTTLRQIAIDPNAAVPPTATFVVPNEKVEIPRLRTGIAKSGRRVPRACHSCRQRKMKCTGDTPSCRKCQELGVICEYPAGWKERKTRQLEELSKKTQDYEKLLETLEGTVGSSVGDRIHTLLEKYKSNREKSSSPSPMAFSGVTDRVEEDLNRSEDSRSTGFIGKCSPIYWMQELENDFEQRQPQSEGPQELENKVPLHAVNYHLDDLSILPLGPVNAHAMPPPELAEQLFESYLTTVHPSFPILNRTLFRAQFRTFIDDGVRPGDKWLAILNIIFAIGARYAHLVDAPWRGDPNDHLIYLTRARVLSVNSDAVFCHPDLQQVQVEGLTAFYLYSTHQINRAWRTLALAIRSAIALGVNLKNFSESMSSVSKEARYRLWWGLYSLEHILGVMTGRPTCLVDRVYTAPLPLPFDDDQLRVPDAAEVLHDSTLRDERINNVMTSSRVQYTPLHPVNGEDGRHHSPAQDKLWLKRIPANHGLYYLYYCDLVIIKQEIVRERYAADNATLQTEVEQRIGDLRTKLEIWRLSLPREFDFTQDQTEDQTWLRCKLSLAFQYHNARIILGRSCLFRRDSDATGPPNKADFGYEMAVLCLESAKCMLSLLPDEPDVKQLYEIGPWWSILHHLMQTTTILLLLLSFGCFHMLDEEATIRSLLKKSLRWLHVMSEHCIASQRAWQFCDRAFRNLAESRY